MTFKINKINVEDQLFSYTRVEILWILPGTFFLLTEDK